MSTPAVPRTLQLPPSQRAQSEFKEQRRQRFEEHLLKRKPFLAYKQENQISSGRGQRVMVSEDQVQERTKVLNPKTKMADKENIRRHTGSTSNTKEKNYSPLKPNELTDSTTAIEKHNFESDNQTLQLLPIIDDPQNQNMTLSQAFHLKNNNKKKQTAAEKPKQDVHMPKKPVLGCYRGQIVQSKINSFRKRPQVKDECSAITNELSATISTAIKPESVNISNVTVRRDRASNMTVTTKYVGTKPVSTTSQNTRLVRPPIKSHHNNTQNTLKQGISRTSSSVAIRKGPLGKEVLQSKTFLSNAKTSSQDISKVLSGNKTSEVLSRPISSSTKLIEKSETINRRRYTIAKATISRSALPKETAEERKARLSEWRANKGKVLKRPPNSIITHSEPEKQNENSLGSFWTTMAEEDEQRLFTEKVNKTFSECLNLIDKGCPKEEILTILNDLIKNIPDARKLVKYWICLIRIEPITSPIENIISIYEEAILAGAQPIEEMRHMIVDILTMKSQEKVNRGESVEDAHKLKEKIPEASTEDTGVSLQPGKPEMEDKHLRNVSQDCGKQQDGQTKDPNDNVKTPDNRTRSGCLIKYNISTTPYLESIKKKMQLEETNSAFKELKFLTPVRRSRRLQDKTSKLPDMLKDHYPCVSSLEQLSELGGETDAFVCRPNIALCPLYTEIDTAQEK
ncbi:cytoskeleton-associated protein 2 [Ctenodactylus gundi]